MKTTQMAIPSLERAHTAIGGPDTPHQPRATQRSRRPKYSKDPDQAQRRCQQGKDRQPIILEIVQLARRKREPQGELGDEDHPDGDTKP